jgi:hypothetical protein
LKPYPDEWSKLWSVDKKVGNVRNKWDEVGASRLTGFAQPNEIPSLFSVRQITRHSRLERARSKERANELGMPTEDTNRMHEPTFVRLRTVQSQRDELLFKRIVAFFNTRVR